MRRRLAGRPEWTATPNPHAPDPDAGPEGGSGKPDEGDDKSGQGDKPDDGKDAGKTFTQADVDRLLADRLNREIRNKYAGVKPEQLADLKAKADQYETLVAASRTDQERAVDEARKTAEAETRAAERATAGPQLVALTFRAYGRDVPETVLDGFLEDVNHGKYLKDDGTVDVDAVKQRVTGLAVKPKAGFPDLGQGPRDHTKTTGVDAGRARYEARRKT